MYIKESIEYLEHRYIPVRLRSPMLLYDFLWFSTPWTKTKTPFEEQHWQDCCSKYTGIASAILVPECQYLKYISYHHKAFLWSHLK